MAAIAVATGMSRALSHDTIYTLKLRRRGVDLGDEPPGAPFAGMTVATVMEPLPQPLGSAMPLTDAAEALARSPHGVLPVLAADGTYLGTASARTAAETLAGSADGIPTVGSIAHLPHPVTTGTELSEALNVLVTAEGAGVPVLDSSKTHLTGWITHQSVLHALHKRTAHTPAPEAGRGPTVR
jgi:CIC family chloride channel protein